MIIMKAEATDEEVANVVKEIRKCGLRADVSRGEYRTQTSEQCLYGPNSLHTHLTVGLRQSVYF